VKGTPDNQHELMVTGLTHCLRQAYPVAEFSFGTKIDLGLKPDLFVVHPDGRRWAYEMINKHAEVGHVELKHRQYEQAGVQVYWLLWEKLAPGKPLDPDKVAKQLIWATEAMIEGRRQYRLTQLHRTLARLGAGNLYVFSLDKPLLDHVEHWLFKLLLIGLDIYHVSPDQLQADQVESSWDFIPLPYLTFDDHGQPQLKPGAGELAPTMEAAIDPIIQIPSDKPFLLKDMLHSVDGLLSSPNSLQPIIMAGLEPVLAQKAVAYSEEELQEMAAKLPGLTEQVKAKLVTPCSDPGEALQILSDCIANLPPLFQDAFREVLPLPDEKEFRLMIELKQWLEKDPHLQALLAAL
jgi:hypothetical protein